MQRRAAGFTLLEMLVAVAIFTVVGILALGGYNELVKQSGIATASAARTRAVQAAVQRMALDFAMLEPRPVREPLGETLEPALRAQDASTQIADLTRAGWSNPAGVPRATLQRVAYRLEEQRLHRLYWPVLDRTLANEAIDAVLLEQVREVRLRFLDVNRNWHERWPPAGYSAADAQRVRPIAVEITLELVDWGRVVRLVEVPG